MRSQILASRGFVTLALQYFDWRGEEELLPTELVEVPLEFVESSVDWLLEHDRVSGSQIGVWGGSKGGELALLSASRFDTIGPVVSVNGSGVVWEGIGNTDFQPGSSWSVDGDPVPYVPYPDDPTIWNSKEYEPAYTASYEEATDDEIAAATITVEEIDGPVVLVSGGDDSLWPSVTLHTISADRLAEHNREYGYEYDHLVYDDAGHAITYPFLPTANRTENAQYVFGGTQEGYAEADRDYWPKMVETFETLQS
ncbi:acyl-CoA thioester hydrolase/BAAT C-terminal domain-containing protein [Halomontanus rarus]|uniref:acyl-CoA thioester hydrolase/BAAT C-terminal domain-containing protein n=1 Tax=Halomontanus rarus TaxID=3034020 RepID=UPI001A98BC92